MKAISAIIATIMLLMVTVSLVGVFYVFSSTIATTTTASGGQQASQLTAQLSFCMQIDNIYGNQITLRNCGKGVIENKSLIVMIDDIELDSSTATIQEGNSSVVNVSGLWQIPFGKRNLKISNGAAVAQALVDVQPNKDGLVGSWGFDEGQGNKANDGSGNNNVGTLLPFGSEPTWVNGKFGKGLQFDGTNDYVSAGNATSLNITNKLTLEAWVYIAGNGTGSVNSIVNKDLLGAGYPYMLWYQTTGKTIRFSDYNTTKPGNDFGISSGLVNFNTWYHVVGVFDNSLGSNNAKIYLNGVLKDQSTYTGALPSNIETVRIGRYGTNYFNGTIDEVRIWNKSFAPDETVVMKQII